MIKYEIRTKLEELPKDRNPHIRYDRGFMCFIDGLVPGKILVFHDKLGHLPLDMDETNTSPKTCITSIPNLWAEFVEPGYWPGHAFKELPPIYIFDKDLSALLNIYLKIHSYRLATGRTVEKNGVEVVTNCLKNLPQLTEKDIKLRYYKIYTDAVQSQNGQYSIRIKNTYNINFA